MTVAPPSSPSSRRLPGSTGMPKAVIRPPAFSIAAGMTSRRSVMALAPKTRIGSAPSARGFADRARQRLGFVGHAPLEHDLRAERLQPSIEGGAVLVEDGVAGGGQGGGDEPDASGAKRAQRSRAGPPRQERFGCSRPALRAAAKGMILTVASIWRGCDAAERRHGRQGDRLVDVVEAHPPAAHRSGPARPPLRTDWRGR